MYKVNDKDFNEWYSQYSKCDYVYRYIDYCHQDVTILAHGLIKLQKEVLNCFD